MKFFAAIELLERIDGLIRREQTGSPDEFAAKLGVSRATVCRYLSEMKDRGIPICYNSIKGSYYYDGRVFLKFEFDVLEKEKQKHVNGGQSLYAISIFETHLNYFYLNEWPS